MWAVAFIGAGILRNADDADFDRFIGAMSPMLAVTVAGAAGLGALTVLDSAGWVGRSRGGFVRSSLLAVGLGAAIIVVDSTLGFGEDINVTWPTSLVFYPVMAFIAEVAFHLVPLALIVVVSSRRPRSWAGATMVPMAAVALIEAAYQVLGSATADVSPRLLAYLSVHMVAFAIAGLTSLRSHGFAAMMWLRLIYYAIWHVAWGGLRLELLF